MEHLSPLSGFTQCLDCYARANDATVDPNYGPEWAWRSRHQYYRDSHYRPLYAGAYVGDYYDDYDVRSFDDSTNEGAGDDDDGAKGGFAES
ncbi:MAG TPA: hypothetical protein VEZ11_09495 [Thermoanaerobaculia bacterium]|nr:hypothetical protein [Thermoanaerobaculia bacterium]